MSCSVLGTGQIPAAWQEAVVGALLAGSAAFWIVWGIRKLVKRDRGGWGVEETRRPGLAEVALVVASMMVSGWIWMRLLEGMVESENLGTSAAGGLAELTSCLLILVVLGWKAPDKLRSLGLRSKGLKGHVGWGIVLALAVWPISVVVLVPASFKVVEHVCRWVWDLSYTREAHVLVQEITEAGAAEKILVALLAVAAAPLTEEILFRGLLQGALVRACKSRWTAIVCSAGVFALFHLAAREKVVAGEASLARVETIPALFLLGVVLGYAYEKSGSLYRPMAIHVVFNALGLLTAFC